MAQGRPTKYKASYATIAKKMCELGATDQDIADAFEVNESTINRWKHKYKGFCKSLKVGKGIPDDLVERALYKRAIGFQVIEEDVTTHVDDNGNEKVKSRTTKTKTYPPDATSCICWLNNRKPEEYRNKRDNTESQENIAEVFAEIAKKLPV